MHNLSVCNESQRLSADCEVVKKKKQKKNELATGTDSDSDLRCGDEDATPACFNFKGPIPARNAENIIKKANKTLIRERIRTTANKVKKRKKKDTM